METKNILLVGIGGQGTILASQLLTQGLINEGYDVKMSEVHGMSQREGSVSTHVRYGDNVYSPVIEKGKADIIVGFEQLEVLRNIEYLREDGDAVINTAQIAPLGVLSGNDTYPENVEEIIDRYAKRLITIDASKEAEKLGNLKVMNVILLGALIELMDLSDINWDKIIADNVKEKFIEINQKALELGKTLV